jgi:hypothetical protein
VIEFERLLRHERGLPCPVEPEELVVEGRAPRVARGIGDQQVEARARRPGIAQRHAGLPDRRFDAIRQVSHVAGVSVVPNREFGSPQERDLSMQEQRDIGGILGDEGAAVIQLLVGGEHAKQHRRENDDRHQRDDCRQVQILLALRISRQRGKRLGERRLGTVEDLLHRVTSFTLFASADRCVF